MMRTVGKNKVLAKASDDKGPEIARLTPSQWDEILNQFSDATYEQSFAYSGHHWGEDRLEHLVLRQDGQAVAAAQAVLIKVPGLPRGLAYVKFGPVWQRKDTPANKANLCAILEALRAHYTDNKGYMVTVLPPPEPEGDEAWRSTLTETGFLQRRAMRDPYRYLVNLRLDSEQQRKSLAQKWRYHLNKASKQGLSFTNGRSQADFEAFSALYQNMLDRKGNFDKDGYLCVPKMWQSLPDQAKPNVVIGYHEGAPTVGAVIGQIGDVASYLYGATDNRALKLRAGYALQWHVIDSGMLAGANWYDLGGEAGTDGLRQFKKGLVGREGSITPLLGEWDCWSSELGHLAGDAIYLIRSGRAVSQRISRYFKDG